LVKNTELAWCAGFYDGEGSSSSSRRYKRKDGTILYVLQVQISQSGLEGRKVLERFRLALGTGKIYGPISYQPKKQLVYHYVANGFERTERIRRKLWKYLSSAKRKQFLEVIQIYKRSRRK